MGVLWYQDTRSIKGYSMRSIHDETARFRANAALLGAARQRARQQGMTLSEFFRAAVRNAVREAA